MLNNLLNVPIRIGIIGKFLGPFVVMATIVYVWNGRQNFIARQPSQKRLTSLNGHYTQKKARWHIYNGHIKKRPSNDTGIKWNNSKSKRASERGYNWLAILLERSRNQQAENKAHEHVHTGNQSGGHATLRIVLQNILLSLATWQISFFIMISYDASGLPCTVQTFGQ